MCVAGSVIRVLPYTSAERRIDQLHDGQSCAGRRSPRAEDLWQQSCGLAAALTSTGAQTQTTVAINTTARISEPVMRLGSITSTSNIPFRSVEGLERPIPAR